MAKQNYTPNPIDTSSVVLPEELAPLAEELAKNVHEVWAQKRIEDYASFNEFFTRRLKRGARPVGEGVISPADARLMLYPGANIDAAFPLKGARKTLREVIGDAELPSEGLYDIAVFRLAPVDYHRFHFPCDCADIGKTRVVAGKYHSVNPIALLKYPDVYADNERQITKCKTVFGPLWLVDVGAFGVGTIVQTFKGSFAEKGEEKGFFKFGGSTVIMVTQSGKITFDDDIRENSSKGFETRVFCRETIGR